MTIKRIVWLRVGATVKSAVAAKCYVTEATGAAETQTTLVASNAQTTDAVLPVSASVTDTGPSQPTGSKYFSDIACRCRTVHLAPLLA